MKCGIKVVTKKKFLIFREKKDLLELDDLQFITVLVNTLKSFSWKEGQVSPNLIERVIRNYLSYTFKHPERKTICRVGAILALEEMGKRFVKNQSEWQECLKELGFVQ